MIQDVVVDVRVCHLISGISVVQGRKLCQTVRLY